MPIGQASQVVRVVKNSSDVDSISELERSPGGGHGNPLQYPCLENPMNSRAWRLQFMWSQSQTWLKQLNMQACLSGISVPPSSKHVDNGAFLWHHRVLLSAGVASNSGPTAQIAWLTLVSHGEWEERWERTSLRGNSLLQTNKMM